MKIDKIPEMLKKGSIASRAIPKITAFFKDSPPGKILDVGCGVGLLSNIMKNLGCGVYACDARNILKYKNIKWKSVDLNGGILPYKDAFFDYVLFIEVVEHLENPRKIIREISRVLKAGGVAILSTPHILSVPQRVYFLLTGNFLHFPFPSKKYQHITPISLYQIKDELEKCDLKIEEITYDRGWIPLLRITLPPSFLFGDLCIIKVKKK